MRCKRAVGKLEPAVHGGMWNRLKTDNRFHRAPLQRAFSGMPVEDARAMIKKTHLSMVLTLGAVLWTLGCHTRNELVSRAGRTVSGVDIEVVRLESVPEFYRAVGTVRSLNTSFLNAQMGGTVREVLVKAGDRVRRGELLAVLDGRAPKAQLAAAAAGVSAAVQALVEVGHAIQAARAQRRFAEATFKRYQNLLAKNSVSRQEFDNAQTRYQAALASEQALEAKKKQVEAQEQEATAQQSSAETTLSYSRIVAPVNGEVTAKSVDAGTVVMPGTALLTIEDDSQFDLQASLPEALLAQVKTGETVQVTVGTQPYSGRVTEIIPTADPSSRTFSVKIRFPSGCSCQSGDYGKAKFPIGEEQAFMVPSAALLRQGELVGVFVINPQGVLEYRLVNTGRVTGDRVAVLSGLNPGDRVAVSQINKLRQGDRVEGR